MVRSTKDSYANTAVWVKKLFVALLTFLCHVLSVLENNVCADLPLATAALTEYTSDFEDHIFVRTSIGTFFNQLMRR